MDLNDDRKARLVAAFVECFHEDAELGHRRPLAEYLQRFPDAEDLIAREYLELIRVHHVGGTPDAPANEGSIGRYDLLKPLGRGGQGIVWLAEDRRLGRRVALKVLHSRPAVSAQLERFQREAVIASRLSHPGICRVYDTGCEDGVFYIAMEYVAGHSLAEWISERSTTAGSAANQEMTPTTLFSRQRTVVREQESATRTAVPVTAHHEVFGLLDIFEQVAHALHAAHEAGFVHRDIKPQNIMLRTDGTPVVLDFGIARSLDGGLATLTRTGDVFGTPAYMAPEQLEGRRVDHRCDIYALGATLYECLTLRRPFEASTHERLLHDVLNVTPPSARQFNSDVPRDLVVVLETALNKDAARRYQTAADLGEDLGRVRHHRPIAARVPPLWLRAFLWSRRHRALATSLCASVVFLVAGLVTSLIFLGRANEQAGVAAMNRGRAEARLREFEQMSDASLVRRLATAERLLWPRRAERIQAMESWLHQVESVIGRQGAHEKARAALVGRAAPFDDAERAREAPRRRERYPALVASVEEERETVRRIGIRIERLRTTLEAVKERGDARDELAQTTAELEKSLRLQRIHEAKLAELEADPRFTERLDLGTADELIEWRYDVLTDLLHDLDRLRRLRIDVERRLETAKSVEKRSLVEAHDAWESCLADLRNDRRYLFPSTGSDGRESTHAAIAPIRGLVPLGRDQVSGLWEFWFQESGSRPPWNSRDAISGSIDCESYRRDGESGIVLVLLPGGSFTMGAEDDGGLATPGEQPLQRVTLAPFFLSKFETTQGQWRRIAGANPSRFNPELFEETPILDYDLTLGYPVTDVNHDEALEMAWRLELELPTEAQWEYAARAGTTTAWWTGPDPVSIIKMRGGNINADLVQDSSGAPCDDGNLIFSPVGSYRPNPFGLHDMIGNLSEWTRDRFGRYGSPVREGDGLRENLTSRDFVFRDGSFKVSAEFARSAQRFARASNFRSFDLGLRFSRALSP